MRQAAMATDPIRTGSPCAQSFSRTPRPCGHCGVEFTPDRPGGRQRLGLASWGKYCSNSCSSSARAAPRPEPRQAQCSCGATFTPRNSQQLTCSRACSRARAKAAARASNMARDDRDRSPRPCKECEALFAPAYGNHARLFCSLACGRRWAKRVARKKRGSGRHRPRARRAGVAYEPVDRIKVFERDGWRCQICGCATPRAWMGSTRKQAPELDHRIPLALGGGHTWANVQLACRRCNAAKGGTRAAGQIPLFARAA